MATWTTFAVLVPATSVDPVRAVARFLAAVGATFGFGTSGCAESGQRVRNIDHLQAQSHYPRKAGVRPAEGRMRRRNASERRQQNTTCFTTNPLTDLPQFEKVEKQNTIARRVEVAKRGVGMARLIALALASGVLFLPSVTFSADLGKDSVPQAATADDTATDEAVKDFNADAVAMDSSATTFAVNGRIVPSNKDPVSAVANKWNWTLLIFGCAGLVISQLARRRSRRAIITH